MLDETYPDIPEMDGLEQLSSWASVKLHGILTCGEETEFYGYPESWLIFFIELNSIILKQGLLELLPTMPNARVGETPPNMFFLSIWFWRVLLMSMKNTTLCWTMLQGEMGGIHLWAWMKFRYEITDKLQTLKQLYRENIRSLNIKVNGLLFNYIDRF